MVRPPVGGSTSPSPLLVAKELNEDLPKLDTNLDLLPPLPHQQQSKTYYSPSGNLHLTTSPPLPGLEEEGKGLRAGDSIDVRLVLAQLEGKVEAGGPRWEEVELRLVGNSAVHSGMNDSHDFLFQRFSLPITSASTSSAPSASPLLSPPSPTFNRSSSAQPPSNTAQWRLTIPEHTTCTCAQSSPLPLPSSFSHHSFNIGYSLQVFARGRRKDNSPVMDKLVLRFRIEQPSPSIEMPIELEPKSAILKRGEEGWKSVQLPSVAGKDSMDVGEEVLDRVELAYRVTPSTRSPQRTTIDYHLSYSFHPSSSSCAPSSEPPISASSLSHLSQTSLLSVHSRVILNRAGALNAQQVLPKLPLAGLMERRDEGRWVEESRDGKETWFWKTSGALEVPRGETKGVEVCNAAVRYQLNLRIPEKMDLVDALELVANNVILEVSLPSQPSNSLGLAMGGAGASMTSSPASSRPSSPAISQDGFRRPSIRQHSRSSSQVATLASFAFSPTSNSVQLPNMPISPPRKPRYSASGLDTTSSPESVGRGRKTTRSPPLFAVGGESSSSDEDDDGDRQMLQRAATLPIPPSDVLPPTDPIAAAQNSFPDTSSSLAQLIQQKRRQASAPYFASARSQSLFSPGAGFGIVSVTESGNGRGGWSGPWGATGAQEGGRTRSRVVSRTGSVTGLNMAFLSADDGPGMVMTPTTEEWRQLGGQLSELADIRAKDEARLASVKGASNGADSPSTPDSSSSVEVPETKTLRRPSSVAFPLSTPPLDAANRPEHNPPTPPPALVKSSFSYQTSRSGFSHNVSKSLSNLDSVIPATAPIPSSEQFQPSHRPQISDSSIRPNLTRGSLSSSMGTAIPSAKHSFTVTGAGGGGEDSDSVMQVDEEEDEIEPQPTSPVPLDWIHSLGPVKPNRYSAITGMRGIKNFAIEGEAGKGAYGMVRKAREIDANGEIFGPQLIIKYIVKQRILADCWKKHNVLGPIPIEIHVLDHLRRVPYVPRTVGRRKPGGGFKRPLGIAQRRNSAPSLKEGTVTGHPNICGMLDFFEDGEFYYLIMPQAGVDPTQPSAPSGQDLFDYVDLHPDGLEPSVILRIFSQIADALFFLHSHGIVHRDIKDENIVLDHQGNVQVIDFGSAAYVKEGRKFDTFSGTLDFAAPEVLRGQRYGGKETDIWALGVLGYVLICGECPFWSPEEAMRGLEANSRAELSLRAKCSMSASSSLSSHSDSSATLGVMEGSGSMADAVDLVMRCLEVDPVNRPTSDEILDHKFILGSEGWRNHRGWLEDDDVD